MITTIFKALLSCRILSMCALLAIWSEAAAINDTLPALEEITQSRHSGSIRIKQFGTAGVEQAYKSVLDKWGNLYVTGYTTGDLDGPGPGVNAGAGSYDIYVMKLRPQGQVAWIRQFGSPGDDRTHSIALDPRGYVYVTGHTVGDLDGSGPEIHHGGEDAFLLKLDEYGQVQWLRQFGTSADEMGLGLGIDAWGNPCVVGYTEGDIDGDGPGVSAGSWDIILAEFDTAGSLRWTRQIGSPDYDFAFGLTFDVRGNIYVTGSSYGDLDNFGSQVNAGEADIVILKFNPYGESQWIRQLGTPGDDYGYAITADHHDRLAITGYVSGDLDGDGHDIHAGRTDLVVIKMSPSGDQLWSRQFGAARNDFGRGIAVNHSGEIYVTGATSGDLDGPGPQSYHGKLDVVVIKLSRSGITQWTRQWGTPGNDLGLDILLNWKKIYITGQTQGDLDGSGPQTHAGDFDSFILKLSNPRKKLYTEKEGVVGR